MDPPKIKQEIWWRLPIARAGFKALATGHYTDARISVRPGGGRLDSFRVIFLFIDGFDQDEHWKGSDTFLKTVQESSRSIKAVRELVEKFLKDQNLHYIMLHGVLPLNNF